MADTGEKDDYKLQCPWSKCFPQLYQTTKSPCTNTSFPDFRVLGDHINKYHTNLLGCPNCDHRYLNARRKTPKDIDDLNAEKRRHRCNSNKGKNAGAHLDHVLITMTEEQDKGFRLWKRDRKKTTQEIYASLCYLLFGDEVEVPDNYEWNYWIPECVVNQDSWDRGQRNLEHARRGGQALGMPPPLPPTTATVDDFTADLYDGMTMGTPPLALTLDDNQPVSGWAQVRAKASIGQDSGYYSRGDMAAVQQSDGRSGGYSNVGASLQVPPTSGGGRRLGGQQRRQQQQQQVFPNQPPAPLSYSGYLTPDWGSGRNGFYQATAAAGYFNQPSPHANGMQYGGGGGGGGYVYGGQSAATQQQQSGGGGAGGGYPSVGLNMEDLENVASTSQLSQVNSTLRPDMNDADLTDYDQLAHFSWDQDAAAS
ncbi:hypothetical protein SAMD00023353_2500890 [Rosellinia necatrix]|uniref:Uncharacterized protein n=1 Tax=Rosellinia necatrix TaxID=77044 RepID=A0A1W2TG30_ROSNE|nr:hypothetical protein SAMD00023353_2500890 [Rosellinia necatrix]